MGIIGVVAALTLPNLNSSTGDREKVAKVKKIYSNLQDAYGRATAVYGPIDEWPTEIYGSFTTLKEKNLSERLTEFMKISKDYGDNAEYILADGTYIIIGPVTIAASKYYSGAKYVGSIDVDIDGKNKGKDAYGYDRFIFDITDQGIYPDGLADSDLTSQCFVNGYCTRWVIENGNMDYLKVGSDGKCPDGKTILSWTNTTCK